MLENEGHEVLDFRDPSACSLFNDPTCTCPQSNPCADILITDMNMPNMTGLEFIRMQRARGCKAGPKNKLILSAHVSLPNINEVEMTGCPVMRKPFKPADFLNWIEESVGRIDPERAPA